MKILAFRLRPGQLLKEEIEERTKNVKAGVLLSVVAGLENVVLRMAGATPGHEEIRDIEGPFEVVSGTGTFSQDGCHLHISVSDHEGRVIGGHLKGGCRVFSTAEIVVGVFEDVVYRRVYDESTGYQELIIENPTQ